MRGAIPTGDYELAPQCTRSAAGELERRRPDGQTSALTVQNELHWTDATYFRLLRRSDQSVQVGGHNVSPTWVADQLQTHPAVADASVHLDTLTSPARLKAFVVRRHEDASNQRAAFEAWTLDTLFWYAALGRVLCGSEVPRNAMGKPCDWP